jgi:hypothetical protein
MTYGMTLPDYGAREERNRLIGKKSAQWDIFLTEAFKKTGDKEFIWLAKNPIPTDELHSGGFNWHKNRERYHTKCERLIKNYHDHLTLDEWLVFYEIFPFFCVIEGMLKHFHFDVTTLKKWRLYPDDDYHGGRSYILNLQPHLKKELPIEEQVKFICSFPRDHAVATYIGKKQGGKINRVLLYLILDVAEGRLKISNFDHISEPFKFFFGKSIEEFGLEREDVSGPYRIEELVNTTKDFNTLERVMSVVYLLGKSTKHHEVVLTQIKRIEEAHRRRYAELLDAARKRLAQDPDYARVKAADDEGWN